MNGPMADSDSSFRSMAWSSVLLGVVLALAHVAWFSLSNDKIGKPAVGAAYVALTGLAVLGWSLVSACGVLGLATGLPPRLGLACTPAASSARPA